MNQNMNIGNGPVTIPMTNDYLFRALLQKNNKVLKGLIASLLHMDVNEVLSVEILNPIELGRAIDDKDFYLDVKVQLNGNIIINLEMQVLNDNNWSERSLSYLCRSFDNLGRGSDYINVKPVIQICFLDFTLFPDNPEFYATYKFMNVKKYSIYSDKISLGVIDLKHINLATKEDRYYQIDRWAALFKSTTWEEIKMLAQNNEYIKEASETIYQLTQEEQVRMQCEAREEYYRIQRYRQHCQEVAESKLKETLIQLEENQKQLNESQKQLNESQKRVEQAKKTISQKDDEISKMKARIEQLEAQLKKM